VNITDVQLALVHAWHLPQLLVALLSDGDSESPRVRNVVLAADLARHAANGWDDPALPDDFEAIGKLLHLKRSTIMQRVGVPEEYWQAVAAEEEED